MTSPVLAEAGSHVVVVEGGGVNTVISGWMDTRMTEPFIRVDDGTVDEVDPKSCLSGELRCPR